MRKSAIVADGIYLNDRACRVVTDISEGMAHYREYGRASGVLIGAGWCRIETMARWAETTATPAEFEQMFNGWRSQRAGAVVE